MKTILIEGGNWVMGAKNTDNMPLLPKPADGFWAVCNRYYADGESVQFKCLRGDKYVEGTGKIVRADKNQYGRVSYLVKPDKKEMLSHGSSDERKEGRVHANLEDLFGGPWGQYDPEQIERRGRQSAVHGGAALPEKVYEFRIKTDDKGHWALERRHHGFTSDFEIMGWLDYLHREFVVNYLHALRPKEEEEVDADQPPTNDEPLLKPKEGGN